MGCTNAQVVWSVTLPTALPSVVTGVILAWRAWPENPRPALYGSVQQLLASQYRRADGFAVILIYNFSSMPFENQIELAWRRLWCWC